MEDGFLHEALLYAGADEFVDAVAAYVRAGLAAGEPVLVSLGAAKTELLRRALRREGDGVRFADMDVIGANPARLIPLWRAFAEDCDAAGGPGRGVAEPAFAGRSPAELVECQRHESLLNLAFAGAPAWRLLCTYDVTALDPDVVAGARRRHPYLSAGGTHQANDEYLGIGAAIGPFAEPLVEPLVPVVSLTFGHGPLGSLRSLVASYAERCGLGASRTKDLVLAVNEVATNSLRHGGGHGALRLWSDGGAVVCEIRDAGQIEEPLAGRSFPPKDGESGRGLWLANQLCDLVQVRTFPSGSVVRLHMRCP